MTVVVDPKTRQIVGQVLSENEDGTLNILTREGRQVIEPSQYRLEHID